MVMLFHFQRKNVIVTGDVGMQSAVRDEYELPAALTPKEVDAFIVQRARAKWAPFASAAAYYLWTSHGAFVPGLSGVSLEPATHGADVAAGPITPGETAQRARQIASRTSSPKAVTAKDRSGASKKGAATAKKT